ncbi:MAG TPA: tRNA epoxyqueuosine(34) reductase QueG [Gammaproteobacteria bacterium]|nr:tRNA epoxyqueuosine(34) reductase QueG [Gammaproteobacteria bacterium]
MNSESQSAAELARLAQDIRQWGDELGFQQIGITDIGMSLAEQHLDSWLSEEMHGDMEYMARHGHKRSRPADLVPGTLRIISARMDYLPEPSHSSINILNNPMKAYVSRYALGRDYHKLIRRRLAQLSERIRDAAGEFGHRVFTDSAPVLEKAIAEKAGLGWIGKHSNLINRQAGSWFFLGEIYTDLPLPVDQAAAEHCGSCQACMDICPTQAIVAPFRVDARLCISYLTIEYRGIIDEALRPLLGNRIYGCDDCQLVCPWNRFSKLTNESDFHARRGIEDADLLELFSWTEQQFLDRFEGSAIRRIGYECWQRNIAIALGNAPQDAAVVTALETKLSEATEMVAEHIEWAIRQQTIKSGKS